MDQIAQLQQMLKQSRRVVFFGGAGVSTESGIPDFRSTDGLYHQKYPFPPETMLSHTFYRQHPEEFFAFYRDKMLYPQAKPNAAHKKLAELEAVGRASILIPSPNVAENHQYYNALELQNAGAAIVIEEKDLTGDRLIQTVEQLLAQPGQLTAMGSNAKALGKPDSLERITQQLLALMK